MTWCCRQYRKRVLVAMPQLKNFDDMPCFDRNRRLAAAFMRGGVDAERAERAAIKGEEAAKREADRDDFARMVADAKAEAARSPPPLPDPMRFRAVPTGAQPRLEARVLHLLLPQCIADRPPRPPLRVCRVLWVA